MEELIFFDHPSYQEKNLLEFKEYEFIADLFYHNIILL